MAKEKQPKEPEARFAFDVTGPSVIMASLRRSEIAARRAINKQRSPGPLYQAWSIGKADPNILFLAENRRQFGTHKPRQKK